MRLVALVYFITTKTLSAKLIEEKIPFKDVSPPKNNQMQYLKLIDSVNISNYEETSRLYVPQARIYLDSSIYRFIIIYRLFLLGKTVHNAAC